MQTFLIKKRLINYLRFTMLGKNIPVAVTLSIISAHLKLNFKTNNIYCPNEISKYMCTVFVYCANGLRMIPVL